jgi:hypothetical protein
MSQCTYGGQVPASGFGVGGADSVTITVLKEKLTFISFGSRCYDL